MRIQKKISLCSILCLCGHYNIFQRFRVQLCWNTLLIVGTPPPLLTSPTLNQGGQGGGFDFLKFSHKKGKVRKIGCVWRNRESLISTNPLKLSFSLYMFVVCVFLICTISNSILCVSQEELRLIEKVIFEKQRHCEPL